MKTKNTVVITGNVSIEFHDKIKPENLIRLSADYWEHVPVVMEYVKINNYPTLFLKRIEPDGSITEKKCRVPS